MIAMMSPLAPERESERQQRRAGETRVSDALLSGHEADRPAREEPEIDIDARFTVSGRELLRRADFAQMSAAELAEAKRALSALTLPLDRVVTRRFRPSKRQIRIDPRATMRDAMRFGGELILPRFRERRVVYPRSSCLPISPAR